MTIASTNSGAGTEWTNVISEKTMAHLQFEQTQGPQLSGDNATVTLTFFNESLTFTAVDVFGLNPPSGVIDGLETEDFNASGINLALGSFFGIVRDGDIDALNLALWSRADTISGGASDDTIRGFTGSDTLYGNDGNDRLSGDGGNDKLYGGNGNDQLFGGVGADRLLGQNGNDALSGGAGNDQLTGGGGVDQLNGGSGADTFIWKAASDFVAFNPNQPFGIDFVRDFNHAEGDLIDFSAIDANAALAGNQAFTFIGSDAFGTDTPGQIHTVATANPFVLRVELNTDGDSDPEFAINVITYTGTLVAGDFVL